MSDTDNAGWTGAPPGMLQDDSAGMSKWMASKPDAMRNAREAAAAIAARAPECVIVCQQSVDCGAWPDGACEQGCAQAERAQAETHPVEVWHGDRKVTVYPRENVLRIHGRGPQDPITDEPFSLKAVQDAMDWLYEAPAAQAGDELPPLPHPAGFVDDDCEFHGNMGLDSNVYTADQMRDYALAARGAQAGDAALAARGAQAGDAQAKLAQFGALVLEAHRGICDAGDVDGGTLQEYALAAGVLEPRTVTEPCGDHCVCAFDLPAVCYFLAPGIRAASQEGKG